MAKVNCPYCDRSFKNGAGLASHVRSHGDEEIPAEKLSVTPFQCDQCERDPFATENGLKIHKIRMHPKKVKSRQIEPVEANTNYCPCCGFNLKLLAHAMAALGGLKNG